MMTRVTRHLPEHNGIPQHSDMLERKGMPHELSCHDVDGLAGHVRVTAAQPAALAADWFGGGRAEVMAAGRPLVVERDYDGMGIRVVEPMSGLPLAGFDPGRPSVLRRCGLCGRGGHAGRGGSLRPGRVHLTDGSTLRWICPTRSVFECGFVSGSVNLIRFAYDGTAIICVRGGFASNESTAGSTGAAPDLLALVVLGWFLLLDAGWVRNDDDDADGLDGMPAYADLPEGSAAHRRIPAGALAG